ncbi:hypothetical protein EES40_36850 [Streptomyces sp. ADI93-02]|nr:hypothetical protein EES40_36850 [Streptomyces sp. ADI93-02]
MGKAGDHPPDRPGQPLTAFLRRDRTPGLLEVRGPLLEQLRPVFAGQE